MVVGGAKMFNKDLKRRECLGDVQMYDPVPSLWTELTPGGAYLEPRRYHTACMVGNQLIVHGGLNYRENCLNSTFMLKLTGIVEKSFEDEKAYRWIKLKAEGQGPGNVAHLACQLVLSPERYKNIKLVSLTSLPEMRYTKIKVNLRVQHYIGCI